MDDTMNESAYIGVCECVYNKFVLVQCTIYLHLIIVHTNIPKMHGQGKE